MTRFGKVHVPQFGSTQTHAVGGGGAGLLFQGLEDLIQAIFGQQRQRGVQTFRYAQGRMPTAQTFTRPSAPTASSVPAAESPAVDPVQAVEPMTSTPTPLPGG